MVAQIVNHLPAVQEARGQSLGREDLLGEKRATHSSFLSWEIPWMEEPGGLQSDRTGLLHFHFHWLVSPESAVSHLLS